MATYKVVPDNALGFGVEITAPETMLYAVSPTTPLNPRVVATVTAGGSANTRRKRRRRPMNFLAVCRNTRCPSPGLVWTSLANTGWS